MENPQRAKSGSYSDTDRRDTRYSCAAPFRATERLLCRCFSRADPRRVELELRSAYQNSSSVLRVNPSASSKPAFEDHAGLCKTSLLEAAWPTRGQTPDCSITGARERFVLQSSPYGKVRSVNSHRQLWASLPMGCVMCDRKQSIHVLAGDRPSRPHSGARDMKGKFRVRTPPRSADSRSPRVSPRIPCHF